MTEEAKIVGMGGLPVRRVNVSEILDYQRCPSYWAAKWHYKLGGVRGQLRAALDIGTAYHRAWEQALTHWKEHGETARAGLGDPDQWVNSLQLIFTAALEDRGIQPETKDLTTLKALGIRAAWWWRQEQNPPFKHVLATEHVCERVLGVVKDTEVRLFGRLDAVVDKGPDARLPIRHFQIKTSGTRTPAVLMRIIKRSLHESGYSHVVDDEWRSRGWGGTHLHMALKLPLRRKDDSGVLVDRNPAEAFIEEDLLVTEAIQTQRTQDLLRVAGQIIVDTRRLLALQDKFAVPLPLEQREGACGGLHQNSQCIYMDSCDALVRFDDHWVYEPQDPLESYALESDE